MGFQLPVPALVEVVLGHGLRYGGIELPALVEVVWEVLLGDVFGAGATEIEEKLSLWWAAGWMEEGRRCWLTDVGEDLGNGHGIGEKRDEGKGCLAGGADQREDLVDPCQKGSPPGRA